MKTDIAIKVPKGTYGRVAPRSGLASKHFIDTGAGVVDEDYRGNVGVLLFNHSDQDFAGARSPTLPHKHVHARAGGRAACRASRRHVCGTRLAHGSRASGWAEGVGGSSRPPVPWASPHATCPPPVATAWHFPYPTLPASRFPSALLLAASPPPHTHPPTRTNQVTTLAPHLLPPPTHTPPPATVKKGDRVAQLVLERIAVPDVHEVESLDATERGANGYGSTGVAAKA